MPRPTRRPAETAGAAGGLTGLIIAIAAGDPLAAAIATAGFLPAATTYLITHGGIRGLAQRIWTGRKP